MNRNVITWPERGKINMMHSDSRVKEPVCLATTSLPDPCLSTYLSPRFREEPFFMRETSVTAWFLQIFGVQEDDFAIAPVILKGLLIDIEDHQQIAETKGAAEHANQRLTDLQP